jgi:hypothetical protein
MNQDTPSRGQISVPGVDCQIGYVGTPSAYAHSLETSVCKSRPMMKALSSNRPRRAPGKPRIL